MSTAIRTHFMLLEGAAKLREHGAPARVCDRMETLAAVARENQRDAVRLMAVVHKCLWEEPDNRLFIVADQEAAS